MKKAAYVVFVGRKPGVYDTWPECKAQVDRYKGSWFKGYTTRTEADYEFEKFCKGLEKYAKKVGLVSPDVLARRKELSRWLREDYPKTRPKTFLELM